MSNFVIRGLVIAIVESLLISTAFAEGTATTQRKFNTWAVEKSKASVNAKENVTAAKPEISSNWKKQLEAKAEARMKAQQAAKVSTTNPTKPVAKPSMPTAAKPTVKPSTATVAKPTVKPSTPAVVKKSSTTNKADLKKAAKEKKLKSKHKNNKKNNKTVVTNSNQKLRWDAYAKTGIKNLSGDAVVKEASKYKGVRYVFGGTTPKGFDCSGYVQYVFKRLNANLTRTADTQVKEGVFVTQRQLKSGDLVFFSTYEPGASHVGIYAGNGKFWNATSSRGIMLCDLQDSYWRTRYYGARRVLVTNGEPK